MGTTIDFGPMREAELGAAARAVGLAFGTPPEKCEEWLRTGGFENLRVLRAGSRPAATLMRIPMGQYFGGRSVPMTGIAGVAVAPEDRGHGFALEMMRQAVREIAAEGTPLSTLYASTQTLYRQAGYEQAGHCCRIRLPVGSLGVCDRAMPLRAVVAADDAAIRGCYVEFARRFDGMLDRTAYAWKRVRRWRDTDYHGWCATGETGAIEGYVFLAQNRKDNGRQDVLVSDIAFTTPAAGRRLLGFLADFATMGDDAVISQAGPIHPMLTLLPHQRYVVERREYWMVRITHLASALEARGYPPAVNATLTIEVRDDLVDANSGTFTLTIENGRGDVTRGGSGAALRCSIGGLVPLYTGLYSASQAALAGLVRCDDAACHAADTIFPGSCPWMADFF